MGCYDYSLNSEIIILQPFRIFRLPKEFQRDIEAFQFHKSKILELICF